MSYSESAKVESVYFDDFEKEYPSMTGKTVVITGTTSGTGFIAARTIAKKGATVVILNRKSQRAEASLVELKKEAPDSNIDWIECDLQNKSSVLKAAEEIKEKYPTGIDVLCNNAGVMALEDRATGDGYDVQMQTNHLSHFLLTKELYPLLEKTANEKGESRIVNHSSGARNYPATPLTAKYFGKNGGDLEGDGNWFQNSIFLGPRWQRYHQSKLANSVFTQELHQKLAIKESKVKSVCAHPGLSATNLQVTTVKEKGMAQGFLSKWIMKLSQSAEDGTMPLLTCIGKEAIESGQMYGPEKEIWGGKAALCEPGPLTNDEAGKILWEESEKYSGAFEI